MAQQTAVEFIRGLYYSSRGELYTEDFEQAFAMEKEQINKTCYDGYYKEELYDVRNYYKETYEDADNTP